jgi:lysocardiolipin and lysophospholipid acyltransferase
LDTGTDPQADFKTVLHPRSTGLLFILRTLLPEIPDLQLLDVTIGYPGVPPHAYPQDYYGLLSIFFNSVPPPTVHLHLHLHSDLLSEESSGIPSLSSKTPDGPEGERGIASPQEARAFELWLRGKWGEKEQMMEVFSRDQKFTGSEGGQEVVKIRQV